jgi:hypothetical protein
MKILFLSTLFAVGALTCASTNAAGRLRGPLVFHAAGGYVALTGEPGLEVRALRRSPAGEPGFVWPRGDLEALLRHPDLARVDLPAEGDTGTVVNRRGECLSLDPLANSPAWLPCSTAFRGQRWTHENGRLTNLRTAGSLDFWPGYSQRGTFILSKGDQELTVVAAVLQPVTDDPGDTSP